MNLAWLQDFVSVAQNGSFSIAAEKLYSSQANVSKHIQLLEHEIGLPLFDRSTRTIRITPVGEALIPYAEAVIRDCDAISSIVSRYKSPDGSLLKIATVPIMHMYDLQNFVGDFQNNHPNIQLEVTETDMASVISVLSQSAAAVGILRRCAARLLPSQSKWKIYPFFNDEIGLLCSCRSPFAAAESVSITECLNTPLVVLNSGYDEYRILLEQMGIPSALFHPHVRFSSYSALTDYVAGGFGVSFISKGLSDSNFIRNQPNVIWRPFRENPPFPMVIALRETAISEYTAMLVEDLTRVLDSTADHTAR